MKYEKIARNEMQFCEAVSIDPVISQLYSKFIISHEQKEKLNSNVYPTPTAKAKYVLRLIQQGPRYEQALKDALIATDQRHVLKLIE